MGKFDNPMEECTFEEYTRVFNKYHKDLKVHSAYSDTIPGVRGWYTSWYLPHHNSKLLASECSDPDDQKNPNNWTYYINKDLVTEMERNEGETKS